MTLLKTLRNCGFLFALALLAFCVSGAWAQSSATLSGVVTDPSGAAVAHAQVVVHSLATGLDRTVTTDEAGAYAVPSLQPGDYKVQVKASGFSMDTIEKVTLQGAQ